MVVVLWVGLDLWCFLNVKKWFVLFDFWRMLVNRRRFYFGGGGWICLVCCIGASFILNRVSFSQRLWDLVVFFWWFRITFGLFI